MGKPMGKVELKRILKKAVNKKACAAALLEGDDNPQVVKLHEQLLTEAKVYGRVLSALEGDAVLLMIDADWDM